MTSSRTLPEWLDYIGAVHPRSIDLGLERVRVVADRLRVLPPAPRNLVIAGTNGKGSTSIYCEAMLRGAGLKVGTTLSPHLHRFNERIRLDGKPVADARIVEAFERVEAARGTSTLTYFEYSILAALVLFRDAALDVCVLEVGLGGRLDAVNLVDADVAVITSIGLDHQEYLGNDVESIAREKAGVMRSGKPCVFGEPLVPRSIASRAEALEAPLLVRGRDFDLTSDGEAWTFVDSAGESGPCRTIRLAPGNVAASNAATAVAAVQCLLGDAADIPLMCDAARFAALPGRYEQRRHGGREFVLDVAHNPHGAGFLARQLARDGVGRRTIAVMGCLKDKDAAGIVAALAGTVSEWIFVTTQTPRGQAATVTLDKAGAGHRGRAGGTLEAGIAMAIEQTDENDRIVVLGSFDVVERAGALMEGAA